MAFVLAGALASTAGYFYGMLIVVFRTAGLTSISFSQAMVTMVIFGGATSITGGVVGALYVRGMPYFVHSAGGQLLTSGFGLLAVLLFIPGGLASLLFRVRDRVVRLLVGDALFHGAGLAPQPSAIRLEPRTRITGSDGPALEADRIVVRYGGLTAVDGVSITVAPGEIVGLIGPNGAGKTTLFDVLSGQVTPESGNVRLHGLDITRLPPEQRAIVGLGRSFQQAKLFDGLTVLEALQLPFERTAPSEAVPSLLSLPPSRQAERRKRAQASELIDLLGLGAFAEKKCSELSTGTRRVVELGQIVGLDCDVVLLDEPTGGIAQREVEAFTPLLRAIRDHLDASMVIVAHDIPMVAELVDRLYVLSAGKLLHEGRPADALAEPEVVAAYIGIDKAIPLSTSA
jgi:ABC-type branched-subunit amino acid transport system ATPase component